MVLNAQKSTAQLDRDGSYRIAALQCAIQRAGQDGGIQSDRVDVYSLAEKNYAWLTGKNVDTQKPEEEITDAVDPSA